MIDQNIFFFLLYGWIGLALLAFFVLFYFPAPYGRHWRGGWGFYLPSRLGWLFMELVSLIGIIVLFILGNRIHNIPALIFFLMWVFHYSYRAVLFPLTRKTKTKSMPALIIILAIVFNSINSFFNGYFLFYLAPLYPWNWFLDFRFILGLSLFLFGFIIHAQADHILNEIHNNEHKGYGIPRGGLYHWVSCPNYLGEIMEWTGWAVATWSLAGFSFALWTVANLAPRAFSNHRWYLAQFPNYPQKRKALVPFLL
jgi:3-oxo-5-alpha-steroid 4-dehydrogenase 1